MPRTRLHTRRRGASQRRQLSQNFLRDRRVAAELVDLLDPAGIPVVELGAGDGAITRHLVARGHDVTAVELDPRWAGVLRQRFVPGRPVADGSGTIRVVQTDMLRFRFPRDPYQVISNVPYSITTLLLRVLFAEQGWSTAVLMVQWEVARKRAGRTGSTMLTASWAPWYDVELVSRVPAQAFRPVPRVHSGVLRVTRRAEPLLPSSELRRYQQFVESVFTGKGAGLAGVLRPYFTKARLRRWATENGAQQALLPKDLHPAQWASLYRAVTEVRGRGCARRPTRPGWMPS